MSIRDLYSKRQKQRERAGQEDVLQYDDFPDPFRVQVIQILQDALGVWVSPENLNISAREFPPNMWWQEIHGIVAREKGVFRLVKQGNDPFSVCLRYLREAPTTDALDLIEVCFQFVNAQARNLGPYLREHYGLTNPDAAITELNVRCREHGIGYQFEAGEIVRKDSEYIHAEAVKPALQLLHGAGAGFSGPLQEFLKAHEHFRKGHHKEAIQNANMAFESTMKAICAARKWQFDPHKDTAAKLVEIILAHELVPAWVQGQFNSLRSLLDAGLNVVRNKTAGHGQGATPTDVPEHLVAYALHLAAANIVFLIQAHKTKP